MSTILWEILLLLVLLIASAFFSGSETALFALGDRELDAMSRSRDRRRRMAAELARSPESTLVTILFANMVVNVGISVLTASVALRSLGESGLAVAIPVASVLLLLFGEIVPKSAGLRRSQKLAPLAAPMLVVLRWWLAPVRRTLVRAVEWMVGAPSNLPLQPDELPTAVDLAEEDGQITAFEGRMFRRILGFAEMPVGRCMTPRVDMVTVDRDARREEILDVFERSGRSRLPVTAGGPERVEGILLLKDVLTRRPDEDFAAGEIAREATFEPETLGAGELFRRFQRGRLHIAVIVGEHGGVEGLVTLEDLLEELVGEIQDEVDEDVPELEEVEPGRWRGDAGLELDDVADHLRDWGDFEAEVEAVTLSGLLQDELGRVPDAGDEIRWGVWRLRVLTATPNRPRQVEILHEPGGGRIVSLGVALWVVGLSILLNAFFAGIETALTTSRRVRVVHRARRGHRGARVAEGLLQRREASIVGAVIGNNVAIVTGTAVATAVCLRLYPSTGETIAAVIMSAANIVFGEVIPKSLYRAHPESLLAGSAPTFRFTLWLLVPLQAAATVLARAVLWLIRLDRGGDDGQVSRDDLIDLFRASSAREAISDQQGRILGQLAHHGQLPVREVMTPVDRVSRVLEGCPAQDAFDCVRETGHSRIPVVDPSGDIVGLLLFRDLVGADREAAITPLVREVLRVDRAMGLDEAIATLLDSHVGLAAVVGADDRALGIVTLEDLFEVLVGEILDEHDRN